MEDALVIIDCAFQPVGLGAPSGPAGVALADEMRRQRRLFEQALSSDGTGSGRENVLMSTNGPAPPILQDSAADVSVYHSLEMRGSFLRGPVAVEDGAILRDSHGDQVILFGATTIIHVGQALIDIVAQHETYGVAGVALFPSSLTGGSSSAVTRDSLYSVFSGIAALGIRHVSIYQAPSASLVETSVPAEVRLLDAVAAKFPDLVFQVVAGGVQGARVGGRLAARHPNVYVNLQGVFGLLITRPREFCELLAALAADAGYDKLLFASGWSVTRPGALIEAFRALELSAELSAGYRLPPLDARAKAAILGDTAARLLEPSLS